MGWLGSSKKLLGRVGWAKHPRVGSNLGSGFDPTHPYHLVLPPTHRNHLILMQRSNGIDTFTLMVFGGVFVVISNPPRGGICQ